MTTAPSVRPIGYNLMLTTVLSVSPTSATDFS